MKRLFDLFISLQLVCLLFLPFIAIYCVVFLTTEGSVIYWSKRVGKDSRFFNMPKFRTMKINTPEVATDMLNSPKKHLTLFGGVLRKTSLDEIPQLYSVIRGDMSLVGPRPALYNQVKLIEGRKKLQIDKLKPGITGLAQIKGRDEISDEMKIRFDYEYSQKVGLFFDIKIIFLTVMSVAKLRGISH